jgi:hypothetical protein
LTAGLTGVLVAGFTAPLAPDFAATGFLAGMSHSPFVLRNILNSVRLRA